MRTLDRDLVFFSGASCGMGCQSMTEGNWPVAAAWMGLSLVLWLCARTPGKERRR